MDPLSAIGLASAIVQFIDFGFKVAKRLDEFNSKNPGEVPKSLQAISTQLPLLLNALGRIKSDSQVQKLDFDTKCILHGMVKGCMAQIVEVEGMINEISKMPGDSFVVKMKKALTSLKYDEKVWEVERNLHTYISVLILHHVIDSTDVPLPPVDDTFFDVREKRVSPFVDRPVLMQELDIHLHDAARSQTTNPTILLLAGEKGVGKTQLALEYCYQSHSLGQFRTVFWLDASTLENLYLGFESMCAIIKRSTSGSRTEKIAFVTCFLNDLWHPWLLVLDNYEPTALYDHIMELLPSRGYGGIILITRDKAQSGLGKVLNVPKFLTPAEQSSLNSLLVQEVQREDAEGIKRAVEQGADVNTLIWNEWPCLHRAALFGLEDAVEFLLLRGADANPQLNIRKPLYWAASGGHPSTVSLLLDHEDKNGLSSNAADNQAVFNAAVDKGNLDIMRMILKRREVSLNVKNEYGETPLQRAANNGHVEIVKFLVEQGVLVDYYAQGDQALISAASKGHFEIVKNLCCQGKVDPNARDGQGRNALYYAAESKDADNKENGEEMARFLLDKGADPNPVEGSDGPLHQASVHDHAKIVALFLEHGADPTRDSNGWCPLTNAIKYKSPGAIKLLLAARVSDTAARSTWLEAALRYACRAGDRGVVLQLLQQGININAIEETGRPKGTSPLLLAILNGHVKTAQLLVRRGARQDLADEESRLPLPLAAENGYELVVRELLRAGGDPNMMSGADEDTPMILAAAKGHEKVVKVLLENGADKDFMNKFGDMALDVAEEKGHKEVIKLLE